MTKIILTVMLLCTEARGIQLHLIKYAMHFPPSQTASVSEDLLKPQSYKFVHMIYLVQNQFQLMCGWVLVVNGSFPHYTFECVWSLHRHPPSVLSQTGQKFPRTFIITQLSMFSMDFGDHLLCEWYNIVLWRWHHSLTPISPSPVTSHSSWMKGKTIPHRCRHEHLTVIIVWNHTLACKMYCWMASHPIFWSLCVYLIVI